MRSCYFLQYSHHFTGLLTVKKAFFGQGFPSLTKSTWESWWRMECLWKALLSWKKPRDANSCWPPVPMTPFHSTPYPSTYTKLWTLLWGSSSLCLPHLWSTMYRKPILRQAEVTCWWLSVLEILIYLLGSHLAFYNAHPSSGSPALLSSC